MKKLMSLFSMLVMLLVIVFIAAPCSALAETDAVIAQNDTATLVNTLIVALVPIIASLLANFTQKKDTDKPWGRLAKNLVNLFALNFSEKAGK